MSDKTTLQLNIGERLIIANISADAKGPASIIRTVKRVRYAIAARDLVDKQFLLSEMYAQDEDTIPCEFAPDAFEWLVKVYSDKTDWPGVWADWVASLGDKLDTARVAKTLAPGGAG